jgi:hypothetical protein
MSHRPPFDINKRTVNAFTNMGQGYTALEIFSVAMNMKPMTHHHTRDKHVSNIQDVAIESSECLL